MVTELTPETFDGEVHEKGLVMIDIWAPWCAPCKTFEAVVEDVANTRTDIKVCKYNCDQDMETIAPYSILGLPSVLFFKDGKFIHKHSGATTKENLLKIIDGL